MLPFIQTESTDGTLPVSFHPSIGNDSIIDQNKVNTINRIESKEHVFVAMPYTTHFQDVYEFGVYNPIRDCGYICEKLDQVSFTGDILQRIQERIRGAKFVVADLTDARPNVYLEVGFAWGCKKDVILIAEKNEKPHFDVVTHRTIFYENISQLSRDLKKLIMELYGRGEV
jgi:hypothetical protein